MHKTMLKVSLCLLLLSAVIYACGEYTRTVNDIEKYTKLEKDAESLLVLQAEKKIDLTPEPEKELPPEKVFNFQDQNFLEVKGLTPPSDRQVGAGLMVELNTQRILWGKNVLDVVAIASLTKVLTVLTVMDEVDKRDDVTMDTKLTISSVARSTPSSSFLRKHPDREVPIRELLQSAMVKSANDSCQLLAEYFGDGDANRFIAMMNAKARSLKMKDSTFYNAHGLPGKYFTPETPDNTSTMGDLMLLMLEVWEKRKEVFNWTSKKSFILPPNHKRGVRVNNTNPLIAMNGVIGLKTGFTNNAGWCLMTVYKGAGKVYFSIVTGCRTKAVRNSFSRALLLWGIKAGKTLK